LQQLFLRKKEISKIVIQIRKEIGTLKNLSFLMPIILFIVIFSGCTYDSIEIDDQVYTLVIGIDKGISNKVRVTVQFPTYKGGGGGTMEKKGGEDSENAVSGQVGNTIIETVEAPSILEGIDMINSTTTRRISLVHVKSAVFSEELAREGIGNYLETFARYRETRRTMQVIVCRGKAEDYIKESKTNIGESISKAIDLLYGQSSNTGFFPHAPFYKFYSSTLSPYGQAYSIYAGVNSLKNIPEEQMYDSNLLITQPGYIAGNMPKKGGIKIELQGTAIFKGDKMVGYLNGYETRYFLMVINQYKKGIITVEDKMVPGDVIPLDIRLGRDTKVKASIKNGKPVIDVTITVEADLGAIQSKVEYEKHPLIDELNKQLEDVIKKGITDVITKTQNEFNADIFGFGHKISRSFFTIQEFEQYNWLEHYKDAEINVDVIANVRRTGLMFSSENSKFRGF